MRYAVLLLVAVTDACGFDLGPAWGPYPELTNVKVSPTVLRAGARFVASASVALHGDCTEPSISVQYDMASVSQRTTTVSHSFTATPGVTLVRFSCFCTLRRSTFFSPEDFEDVTIQVLP